MDERISTETRQPRPVKKKGKKRALLLLLLLLLLLGLLFYFLVLPMLREAESEKLQKELNAQMGLLPGMSDEQIKDRMERVVAESMLNVSINPAPKFADGGSEGNLRIENIPGNQYDFIVEIHRIDNDEVIYKSGLISPGYYVEKAKLSTVLPAGEYPCIARFLAYNTETQEQIGEAGAQITIKILS